MQRAVEEDRSQVHLRDRMAKKELVLDVRDGVTTNRPDVCQVRGLTPVCNPFFELEPPLVGRRDDLVQLDLVDEEAASARTRCKGPSAVNPSGLTTKP